VTCCLPNPDPTICRRCIECGGVLRVTARDEVLCSRCGPVSAWTVSVNDPAGQLQQAAVWAPADVEDPADGARRRRGAAVERMAGAPPLGSKSTAR
jgi:hypothetical protein